MHIIYKSTSIALEKEMDVCYNFNEVIQNGNCKYDNKG